MQGLQKDGRLFATQFFTNCNFLVFGVQPIHHNSVAKIFVRLKVGRYVTKIVLSMHDFGEICGSFRSGMVHPVYMCFVVPYLHNSMVLETAATIGCFI